VLETHDVKVKSAVNEVGLFQNSAKKEFIFRFPEMDPLAPIEVSNKMLLLGVAPLSNIWTKWSTLVPGCLLMDPTPPRSIRESMEPGPNG
jgi:hypothetical protein